jgi:tRNA nucleotidyltransferase (CCA-adding enzyme)
MGAVAHPPPHELLERLRGLPAADALLRALAGLPGVYLVGGAVRDLLLDRSPHELDLLSEGDVAEVAHRLGGSVRTYDRFGTATVTAGGFTYDLARARRERYPRPGALPEVEPASLSEDLERRDFTVNGIALALGGAAPGELTAVDHAYQDLDSGHLRVIHDASFTDDPTRLLRLARYAARLGFSAEPHTLALVAQARAGAALRTVSGSRIGAELRLLAAEPEPLAGFAVLRELGIDAAVAPGFGIEDLGLARRALDLLPSDGRAGELALGLALRGVPAGGELLDALAFPAPIRERLLDCATRADELAGRLAAARRPSEIAEAIGSAAPELVALAGALGPASAARSWLHSLRDVALEIDGADLLASGVSAGPAVGAGLRAARAAKLDGRAAGRDQELAEALRVARATG